MILDRLVSQCLPKAVEVDTHHIILLLSTNVVEYLKRTIFLKTSTKKRYTHWESLLLVSNNHLNGQNNS